MGEDVHIEYIDTNFIRTWSNNEMII